MPEPREHDEQCDVVIVGSRLAGACAAAHFAKAGRRVVALDRAHFPSDQLSTHLLFPSGVNELRLMGALDGILAQNPTKSPFLMLDPGDGAVARERWRPEGPIDYCLCVPRIIQDVELVKAARAAGADIRERHRVTDVLWRGGRAVGVRYVNRDGVERKLSAKLVLGADGRRSPVAASVGSFAPYRASRNGRGLVFRYATDPMVDLLDGRTISQWRNADTFAMVFPSAPRGTALVLFMGPREEAAEAKADPEGYWARKLEQHPGMARRVEGMTELTPLRSTGDTTAYFRASSGPGWALLGDAGHFKDPVVGQGQRDALWTGRAIAESTADKLDDPAALDLALRRWEHERDTECLHSYHLGNLETEIRPVPPVLIEIVRRLGKNPEPDLSDLFGRSRTLPQVITVPRMVTGLIETLRRGTGGRSALASTREAIDELRVHLRVRNELRGRYFRSSRPVEGSDHPNPQPPSYRPMASTPCRQAPANSIETEALPV
jgi:flavin-dependent dehydrogenase